MRYFVRAGGYALLVFLAAGPVLAQTPGAPSADLVAPPAWAANDVACAPALTGTAPDTTLRVIGSQDTIIKQLFGPGDTLVISGGSAAGLQPGQRFFVRRAIKLPETAGRGLKLGLGVHTAGWVEVLGVDTALATATIIHACDGFLLDDYLEPFAPPMVAARPVAGNTPEYENMGRIVAGDEHRQSGGAGESMTIDRGSSTGVVQGQRFLVFRDKRALMVDTRGRSATFAEMSKRQPLVEVGQVMVIAVRAEDSTVQILVSKDAIATGDLIAPIR